jgi:hypothetical protein
MGKSLADITRLYDLRAIRGAEFPSATHLPRVIGSRMRSFLLAAGAALAVMGSHAAFAQAATANAVITKSSPLKLVTSGVLVDCSWAPGTVVMKMSSTGGDGKAVTYTLGGTPSGDLAISGSNIIVGPNGIAAANCGTVENITINATQL